MLDESSLSNRMARSATPPLQSMTVAQVEAWQESQARREREREAARVADIRALGRPGEEAIIAECVGDSTCTIAEAALRLRTAQNADKQILADYAHASVARRSTI